MHRIGLVLCIYVKIAMSGARTWELTTYLAEGFAPWYAMLPDFIPALSSSVVFGYEKREPDLRVDLWIMYFIGELLRYPCFSLSFCFLLHSIIPQMRPRRIKRGGGHQFKFWWLHLRAPTVAALYLIFLLFAQVLLSSIVVRFEFVFHCCTVCDLSGTKIMIWIGSGFAIWFTTNLYRNFIFVR